MDDERDEFGISPSMRSAMAITGKSRKTAFGTLIAPGDRGFKSPVGVKLQESGNAAVRKKRDERIRLHQAKQRLKAHDQS